MDILDSSLNYIFELNEASYTYMGEFTGLDAINLKIKKGESVAVLGANGSGKSTLLKLLDGLYFPTRGSIKAFGTELTEKKLNENEFKTYFRSKVGLVFQDPDVQLFLPTVWDEVSFAPLQLGKPKNEVEEICSNALNKLGMYNLKDRSPIYLSEGEKKKLTIATVLTLNPDVWLLDEPTASLDPKTQSWMIDFILELKEKGKTVIVATHDLEIPYVATSKCYVLTQDHRIMIEGNTEEILSNSEILLKTNLIHKHRHVHHELMHEHIHTHWK